jgi:hypothetical protein
MMMKRACAHFFPYSIYKLSPKNGFLETAAKNRLIRASESEFNTAKES